MDTKLVLSGVTVLAGEVTVAVTHGGGVGAIAAAAAGVVVYHAVGDHLEKRIGRDTSLPMPSQPLKELGYRLFNGKSTRRSGKEAEEQEDPGQEQALDAFLAEWEQARQASPPIPRVSVEAIVARVQPNSFWIYLGRNLIHERYQVEGIDFRGQHIKIIGRTQMGKSSMTAALLEIITRTHDERHVQLALLDLEHKTSRLFEGLPHVASWQGKKLHATNTREVLTCLGDLLDLMEDRYTLSEAEVERLPYLLIYLEEFLALKKELQTARESAPSKEERTAAAVSYGILARAVNVIALRGLKVRMQFLLCAQVSYADKTFREAMAMFGIGLSFCVKPTAAQAAGFSAYELLQQNYTDALRGSAVLEANGKQALLLAPEYDLHQRLIDHVPSAFARPARTDTLRPDQTDVGEGPVFPQEPGLRDESEVRQEGPVFPEKALDRPVESSDLQPEERPEAPKEYRFTDAEILQFVAAYRAVGNIEKALASLKKGGHYKPHARDILQAYGLRRDK